MKRNNQRVMICSHHYQPEIGAASSRITHIARHMQRRGVEVFIVTSRPNYPNPELYQKDMVRKLDKKDRQEGIRIYRSPALRFLPAGKFSRLVNQLMFLVFALVQMFWLRLRHNVNTCITTSPPFIINLVGWVARKIMRMRWIMEVRDLWPESMLAVDFISEHSRLYRLLKRMELYFYNVCSEIVVVTERTTTHLTEQGIDSSKISVVTNGIPDWIIQYNQSNENNQYEKRNDSAGLDFNVVYIGNMGLSQHLSVLITAASILKDEPIKLYFVGEGLQKKTLQNQAADLGLTNVEFVPGVVDKKELFNWYKKADLGIVCLRQANLFQKVIPSKIFEYAGAHVPMLFIGSGEAADLIEQNHLGIRVDYDAKMIAQHILEYKSTLDTKQYRVSNDVFIQRFAWQRNVDKYVNVLNNKSKGVL